MVDGQSNQNRDLVNKQKGYKINQIEDHKIRRAKMINVHNSQMNGGPTIRKQFTELSTLNIQWKIGGIIFHIDPSNLWTRKDWSFLVDRNATSVDQFATQKFQWQINRLIFQSGQPKLYI